MKITCEKCKNEFSSVQKIDGKTKNLQNRKYCLECSPFGDRNTKNLCKEKPVEIGKTCNRCKTHKEPDEFYRRRNGNDLSPYCKKCTNNQTLERQRGMKQKAVEYKGGKCYRCGYNKCINALEFHHLDPDEKDFTIAHARHTTFDKIKDELDKCVLVCANCHREIHAEESTKTELKFSQIRIKKEKGPDKRLKENRITEPKPNYKIEWPSPEEISKLIWEMSAVQLSKQLGVSDKAIEKFCKKHDIQKPPRGYWAKKEHGKL